MKIQSTVWINRTTGIETKRAALRDSNGRVIDYYWIQVVGGQDEGTCMRSLWSRFYRRKNDR